MYSANYRGTISLRRSKPAAREVPSSKQVELVVVVVQVAEAKPANSIGLTRSATTVRSLGTLLPNILKRRKTRDDKSDSLTKSAKSKSSKGSKSSKSSAKAALAKLGKRKIEWKKQKKSFAMLEAQLQEANNSNLTDSDDEEDEQSHFNSLSNKSIPQPYPI